MPALSGAAAFIEAIFETAVGKFSDDRESTFDHLDPFDRQYERMPHFFHRVDRFVSSRVGPVLVEVAVDELERFQQPAGSADFPHLAVAAAPISSTHRSRE